MTGRIRCLLVAFFVALALPVYAQGNGNGGQGGTAAQLQALTARVAALEAAVSKLQGNITAADLVGTYNFVDFDLKLLDGVPPSITHELVQGTLTLNADGSASISVTGTGHRLTPGSPLFLLNESGTQSLGAWTYDNGTVSTEGGFSFTVGAGGRVLVAGDSKVTSAGGSDVIIILTRLH